MLFHNPKGSLDFHAGYFVVRIRDFHRNGAIDQLNIPMGSFKPFHPIHLEIEASHRENPTQTYQVFLSLTMELPFAGSDDKLVAVAVNWAQFEPPNLRNISNFAALLVTGSFGLGNVPFLKVNPREPTEAIEKMFSFHN